MTDQHQPPSGAAPDPGSAPTGATGAGPGTAGPTFPAGPGADQPPPLTAFAWRNGLVRPTQGRLLAGVCGALGRATNTDPVLWRVLIAVLSIFGGIGVVLFLLGWLLLPADGDTGSPVEAVLGRGHSATSAVLTVIGGIIVLMSFPVLVSEPFRPGPWGVVLIGGALLLLLRDRRRGSTPASTPPPAANPYQSSTPGAPMASPTSPLTAPTPPFAPHGPYVPNPPPAFGPPTYAPPPPRPPQPRQPRSRLGRLIFSVTLVVLGTMYLFDRAGYSIPGPSYFAAALAVVGGGLILGTWVGRARGMIGLGILLVILTGSATITGHFTDGFRAGEQTWVVTSFDQLQPKYEQQWGNATLDLSGLDFATAGGPVTVDVSVDAGNLEIIVPDNVDVIVTANIDVGNADVFDQSWGGIDPGSHTVTDYGDDGRGGGELHINASINAGNLEVGR